MGLLLIGSIVVLSFLLIFVFFIKKEEKNKIESGSPQGGGSLDVDVEIKDSTEEIPSSGTIYLSDPPQFITVDLNQDKPDIVYPLPAIEEEKEVVIVSSKDRDQLEPKISKSSKSSKSSKKEKKSKKEVVKKKNAAAKKVKENPAPKTKKKKGGDDLLLS